MVNILWSWIRCNRLADSLLPMNLNSDRLVLACHCVHYARALIDYMVSIGMKATAELQVVPIGSGVSVRAEIGRVVELLQGHDFIIETHASGTNIEGELTDILAVVEEIHTRLHQEGSIRLVSYLKLETRSDKAPSLAGKRL